MSKLKDQRGVAAVAVVLIVVACLALIGGILYFALKKDGKLPLVGSKFNDQCEYEDKELCKFINNYASQKNFTSASTTNGPDGAVTTSTYIIDGDKFQVISATGGQENYNYIAIGNTTYTKDYSDNQWIKQTSSPEAEEEIKQENQFEATPSEQTDQAIQQTYTFVGEEACGDLTCLKYQVSTEGNAGTEFIWFDNQDYLLRKQVSDLDGITTETLYSYDTVTINEPSPTKDAPATPDFTIPETYIPEGSEGLYN